MMRALVRLVAALAVLVVLWPAPVVAAIVALALLEPLWPARPARGSLGPSDRAWLAYVERERAYAAIRGGQ